MFLVAPFGSKGSKYLYMLYTCYRSRLPIHLQDELSLLAQRLGGWLSVEFDSVLYSVPEDRAYMLFLIDPHLERYSKGDWIA